jgi:hypothetical protein
MSCVARLPPRKPPPKIAATLSTSKVAHHIVPGHAAPLPWRPQTPPRKEPRTPPKEPPPPHTATCRTKSSLRAAAIPPLGALPDPPFDDLDPITPATDPPPKSVRTPPTVESPPSSPQRGGAWGRGNGSPPPSSCPRTPAVRRSSDGEQERRWGGWWRRAARVPSESLERGDTGREGKNLSLLQCVVHEDLLPGLYNCQLFEFYIE